MEIILEGSFPSHEDINSKEGKELTISSSIFSQAARALRSLDSQEQETDFGLIRRLIILDFEQKVNSQNSVKLKVSQENFTSFRIFLDSLHELLYLSFLKVSSVFIGELITYRRASISLGYYRDNNRGWGSYLDDKQLYRAAFILDETSNLDITNLTINQLKKQLEEIDSSLVTEGEKISREVALQRASLKLMITTLQLGLVKI